MTAPRLDVEVTVRVLKVRDDGGWNVVLIFPAVNPRHGEEVLISKLPWFKKPDANANAKRLRAMLTPPSRRKTKR